MVVPCEYERGQRLGVAARRTTRDRGPRCARDLVGAPGHSRARGGQRKAAVAKDLPRVGHLPNVTIMAPLRFDRSRIAALLALAGERLDGEWLLIGGAAAAAWFSPTRTTEDVDLIGLAGTQDERFALMELAGEAALPIEAVNSAGDFFVRKIADWRDQLVVLHRGSRATIFRPTATLFLLLKLARLTAIDLEDCLGLLEHCRVSHEPIDRDRVRGAIAELPVDDDLALNERRRSLVAAIGS